VGKNSINETEWELLDALWEAGEATAPEVAAALEASRGWAYSTVKTLLDRMRKKGLVTAEKAGKTWVYQAAVPRSQARRGAWKQFVEEAFGGAVSPALQFVAKQGLNRKQREELRRLLDELEEGDA
jgi:predicted transcriptional regulator